MKFTDPYINTSKCVNRLLDKYKEYGTLIIGFDFDDTIYDFSAPDTSFDITISLLKECSDMGLTLILYTCCKNITDLDNKIRICNNYGLNLTSMIDNKVQFKVGDKPYFNILLDDKAGLGQSVTILKQALDEIKLLKNVEGGSNGSNA